ncbi:MAG: 2,3-bisphosphoglycerate-independent phosphoglycerate mutase [Pseudomonadota bacterium]|nr:2,3-bisphosphoglycerate-independent phosphoglycerate mutase [Pseudomonadota bacterium]
MHPVNAHIHTHVKKVLLVILDGFGLKADSTDSGYNAIAQAKTPNWDSLTHAYAFGAINASGTAVGLPQDQFGNSEVGHMNIGAGRIIQQDITRIDTAIEDGSFYTNKIFVDAIDTTTSGVLHILGLLSDGGVHSHISHILALLKLAQMHVNIKQVWLHMFLDGRDTPPKSADKYLAILQQALLDYPLAKIATLSGRYYAMDRDKRYDRVGLAYDAIMRGQSELHAEDANQALAAEYANDKTDEFVRPHVLNGFGGVGDGDSMIFANFRSDRAIQLTDAIVNPDFKPFPRSSVRIANFVTMTDYGLGFENACVHAHAHNSRNGDINTLDYVDIVNFSIAYSKISVHNTLGEYISELGLHQLRIAETEKYPHVTFFFNGGRKDPYPKEDRILVDSPKDVATYDLKPEMSLPQVTEHLVNAINSQKYDFIITNFANCDMVGHSGILAATIQAVEAIDAALGKVVSAMLEHGGEVLVIADHGNCEEMFDYTANQLHTQHTSNKVPCLYIGRSANIKPDGALKDVAPTLLFMSGIDQPPEMAGHNLIELI